jgi:hypothetical protein
MNFIENETAQKLRGGYYTPLDLAVFLAQWVKEISPTRILEPSCGDGIFFDALAKVKGFQKADIVGFELEPDEAAKAQTRAKAVGLKAAKVYTEDFLQWAITAWLMMAAPHLMPLLAIPPLFDTSTFQNHFKIVLSKFQGTKSSVHEAY